MSGRGVLLATLVLLAVVTGCIDNAQSSLTTPTCPAGSDCGSGFSIDGAFYAFDCVRVRSTAVDVEPYAPGDSTIFDVRRIQGLPPDAFLAVRGQIPCDDATGDETTAWWIARNDATTAKTLESLSAQLRRVLEP